ncbi:CorA family divalent cation transporter [Zavarzinia aquatilis]|uniref:Mg2+/Co2+ transporter n=1 Tax=Zavarzinia aquatilis TaxID=2211142 RepID=A0A317EHQ4_9PROT|nr:CorA family divalent cation transporter [Zavarzinia aquatilis]PWR25816.1 Mg2+/Co2+ transporter [Zavarzinia aquatilis]
MVELARNPLVELPERRDGIVFCYHVVDGRNERLIGWDAVETAMIAGRGFVWLHLDLSVRRAREWIAQAPAIPEDLRAELGSSDVRTRLESYQGTLFGVFTDMQYDIDPDLTEISTVRIFGSDQLVVSARRHPSRSMDRLRRALHEGKALRGPADLISTMLAHLAETVESAVVELIDSLDDIEDRLLEGRRGSAREDLGAIRRFAVRLHRHLALKRRAVFQVCARPPAFFAEEDAVDLREAIEQLGAVVDDLVSAQERAKLLYEEMAAQQAEVANRNLLILSVLTAVFLPMTLVTGIFGMNVAGLPGLVAPHAFWWTMLLMAIVGVLSFLGLRRLNIF